MIRFRNIVLLCHTSELPSSTGVHRLGADPMQPLLAQQPLVVMSLSPSGASASARAQTRAAKST